MRKLAFCPNCKKQRKLTITIISFKFFTPFDDEWGAIYNDTDLDNICCNTCGTTVQLSQIEMDEVIDAAYKAK